ncbi:hypothetical protein TMM008_40480 [Pseudomonas sp. 008]|nr:hypothetical protein TMM008_40480 [Pseudomonas sp. 008]
MPISSERDGAYRGHLSETRQHDLSQSTWLRSVKIGEEMNIEIKDGAIIQTPIKRPAAP